MKDKKSVIKKSNSKGKNYVVKNKNRVKFSKSNSKLDNRVMKRVKTYIPGFDEIIQGGFKHNSINIIVGGAGSGKTIFALQYLIEGILKDNEPAMYITFEQKKINIQNDMKRFGWDLEDLEKKKKFVYLEYNPELVKRMLVEGGGTIENIITNFNIKRVVIDSITSFSLLYRDSLEKKEAALALFNLIRGWSCTALLTGEDETANLGNMVSTGLAFEVDGIILLFHYKEHGERKRALEILKMRGTAHSNKTLKCEITNNVGFKVVNQKITALG